MKISPSLIKQELSKRTERREFVLDSAFSKQNLFVSDSNRYIVAQTSRRAGKTNGLAIRFFKTMEKHPGAQCLYLSLTLDSAREIMWPVLQELNERFNIGCTFTDSKLIMKHPNGSSLKLYGADMKNFVKRLRGRKYPGVAIDEAQDFGPHLESLIDDVLTPSIADYADGWLAITGTPGPVPQGYFYDITQNRKFGYSFHDWTLLDNPYMPQPEAFIADLCERRGWDDRHPTLLREWRNQWVLDVESLWIQYKELTSNYPELPVSSKPYNYILGVDLGYNDADALAVVAWADDSKHTYLVEEVITARQGITELVQQIAIVQKKYDISKMIIDEGGLGKKIAEELRRRHHIPVVAAEKQRKQETVAFLNDAMRTGLFKAKKTSRFALDSYLVQIDWEKTTPDKIVIKKKPHSDIIDAVIYAFKESPAYSYEKPKDKPKPNSKQWYLDEIDAMEEAAMEFFTAQAATDDEYY